jgi:hypothetical protein
VPEVAQVYVPVAGSAPVGDEPLLVLGPDALDAEALAVEARRCVVVVWATAVDVSPSVGAIVADVVVLAPPGAPGASGPPG